FMKSLKKMKLINWHYFWNETIEFQPLVFLTGLNGSGKSTLIDAMQILLLGDTSGHFFNKAAAEKGARTLKGYLRCELGDDSEGGYRYLRNDRFTSYIAMEFFDDLNNSSFTFGIVFDSYSDGTTEHRFFCLEDKIPENEFIRENVPMEYRVLNQFFQENYPGKFKFLDSNKQYQELLKRKFGGLKEKYFTLFKKAVSFNPITDISDFITTYICDSQQNINITSMQDNILQYKRLQNEANVMTARIERLQEIELSYKKLEGYKEDENLCAYIIDRAEVENDLARIKAFKEQVGTAQNRLREIDNEIVYIDEQIETLNHKKDRLQADKVSNDTFKLTDELWAEKKKYDFELQKNKPKKM
ncbi:MAG: AAA family ATPase, partial [Bacilli bacterium]|nr:AAA family ATPase [Bacilli bacterium]